MDKNELTRDVSWIGARMREPSSYAGLAVILGAVLHVSGAGDLAAALTSIGIGIGGLIAFFLPEKKL